MFDYDRLSLNVAQQFSSHKIKNGNETAKSSISGHCDFGDDGILSNGSSESQIFGNGWDNSPSPLSNSGIDGEADTEENSIVHSLSELLRRRSSPICTTNGKCSFDREHRMSADEIVNGCPGAAQFLQRHRSATVSSTDQVYGGMLAPPSRRTAAVRGQQPESNAMDFGVGGYGIDRFVAMNRRLSDTSALLGAGACCLSSSEMLFDCGASSGYGSPGRTPLASPNAANKGTNSHAVQYIANQLQKLFSDRSGFCCCSSHKGNYPQCQKCPEQQKPQQIYLNGNSTTKAFGVPAVAFSQTNGTTPVLLKATTTTTGTNKNSNKRKLSNVCGTGGGSTSPVPENIVASEDGFDQMEIAEFTQLLSSPKRTPPPRYICHICYQPGHYIGDCPQRFNSPYEELTPYQGRKKCYGEFQCEQCKRKWTSQNSIANEAQSCIKCHVPVFPHKQLPVDKAIALGLVKIQRLPVTTVLATPPTPSAASTPLPSNHGVLTEVL
ncbi:CCHC-type domain-containing protein [Meloidogyne graminicola]|uniref:CCHC-type domain-containing protein n=1 Tax=Meloidogyne graminicola TaxID=189291 RepID=A0A8S9ZI86_9BILA|nr:CCHC-type domain-containing protein [Meloidogyne graminicola]